MELGGKAKGQAKAEEKKKKTNPDRDRKGHRRDEVQRETEVGWPLFLTRGRAASNCVSFRRPRLTSIHEEVLKTCQKP